MNQRRGVLAIVLSTVCWGTATVMSKVALGRLPPFSLLAVQLAASVSFLWLTVLVLRQPVTFDRQMWKAALAGVFEPGLTFAFAVPGLALTTAADASVIAATEPLLIIFIAWLTLRYRPTLSLIAVMAVAGLGVALLALSDARGLGDGDIRGDLLVLAGTAFAAVYVVISSRLVGDRSPLPIAAVQQSVGLLAALVLLVAAVALGFERVPTRLSIGTLALAIVSGVVQFALAFWFYLVGLRSVSLSTAGLLLSLTPVFGVGTAVLFLGERLTAIQSVGAVLIFVALLARSRHDAR